MKTPLISLLLLLSSSTTVFSQLSNFTTIASTLPATINETSGLIYFNGRLVTHNDSGNNPELYEIDQTSGAIVRTVTIANASNNDWEDIAQDDTYLYIGDIGNNSGNRMDLKVYRILKSDFESSTTVQADTIRYSYEDQTDFTPNPNNTEWDAEALIITSQGELMVFTKDWIGNQTKAYTFPNTPGNYQANHVSSLNAQGLITGAAYDGHNSLLLSGYTGTLSPFLWHCSGFSGDAVFGGSNTFESLSQIGFSQIEGIAHAGGPGYYLSRERFTVGPIVVNASLFRFDYITPNTAVYIPDSQLKAALITAGADPNQDGEISYSEAEMLTSLDISNSGITALTGLETFVNLASLNLNNNLVTTIALSPFPDLEELHCKNNSLTGALSLTNNPLLHTLDCSDNPLIGSIDLSALANLEQLHCANTGLSSLSISNNPLISELNCSNNQLTDLSDLNSLGQLRFLDCSSNQITSMSLRGNAVLERLICNDNLLQSLSIANGNNSNITGLWTFNNQLTCIEVDRAGYSDTNWTSILFFKDFSTSYCTATNVYIPDSHMKAALLADFDTDADGEISFPEAEAVNGTLNLNNRNITSLTGIQAFKNITELRCDDNQLKNLPDLSTLTELTLLSVNKNLLTALPGLSAFTRLKRLWCASNQLSSLPDLAALTNLLELNVRNNQLTSLPDLSTNTQLKLLWVQHNQISNGLDFSQHNDLNHLMLSDNQLRYLNLKQGNSHANRSFATFEALNNPLLTCIQVNNVEEAEKAWSKVDKKVHFTTEACHTFANKTIKTTVVKSTAAILIRPNPVRTSFEIQLAESDALRKAEVFDALGRRVSTGNTARVDLSHLSEGIYTVKITTDKEIVIKRIVKQ